MSINNLKVFFIFCHLLVLTKAEGKDHLHHDGLILTIHHKSVLDKFKEKVSPTLPHDYMKEDIYLIRWLRAKHFNIEAAEMSLMKNLDWRKANNMSEILSEDFSDIGEEFPIFVDTFTKNGQPVITAVAGQWDMRKSEVTGNSKRVYRHLLRILEKASALTRESHQSGKTISRFDFLLSMDGFNLAQHGCAKCMIIMFNVLQDIESHYPDMVDKLIVINASATFNLLFGPMIKGLVSGEKGSNFLTLKILGTDKKEWKKYLLDFIDENQLTEDFGGSRVRA